ncbi:hypothetical protein [Promicromonospora soli]
MQHDAMRPAPQPVGPPDGGALLAGADVAVLEGVRTIDGAVVDVEIAEGRVVAVADGAPRELAPPEGGSRDAAAERSLAGEPALRLDARGWLALPAACEPHAHLDKALTAARFSAGTGDDLVGAVAQWRELVPHIDGADVLGRARTAVERYAARGITTIRTHVDAPADGDPLRLLDALLTLREEPRDR